jgi:hypothetical protein
METSAIRKPWYSRTSFLLFILLSFFAARALASSFGSWIWLVWIAVLVIINNSNPGSKLKPTDLPTMPAPAAVTPDELSAAAKKSVWSFFLSGRVKRNRMDLALAQHRTYETRLNEEMAHFQTLLAEFPDFSAATDNEEQLLVIDGVTLVEPRKGPRVTESTSRSSGRPFIGMPIGGVFVGASGRSSSKSTSVSTPAVDELTLVEEGGRFIASTQGIAYVGEMFNRKADYSKIIDWTGEGFQLRISATGRGTNWIVIFERPADMWAVGTLLDAADEIPARALDTSGKATPGEIASAVAASIAVQNEKFAEAKSIAETDIAAIQSQLDLLRKQYPSRVK